MSNLTIRSLDFYPCGKGEWSITIRGRGFSGDLWHFPVRELGEVPLAFMPDKPWRLGNLAVVGLDEPFPRIVHLEYSACLDAAPLHRLVAAWHQLRDGEWELRLPGGKPFTLPVQWGVFADLAKRGQAWLEENRPSAEKPVEPPIGYGFGPGYRINPGEGGRTGESRP